MQSFNRIEDPVIDQDNAKLLGAVGGGVGAWQHHKNSIASRKGFIDRAMGRTGAMVTRPVRSLVGAGLGALAAGTLARYVNKENKEDHQTAMAEARAPQYGMQRYASEKGSGVTGGDLAALGAGGLAGGVAASSIGGIDMLQALSKIPGIENLMPSNGLDQMSMLNSLHNALPVIGAGVGAAGLYGGKKLYDHFTSEKTASEETKTDELIGKGIQGGILGALANKIIGGSAMKGAGVGALANAGYHMYKDQKDTNNQMNDKADYDNQRMERYAMEKEAKFGMAIKGIQKAFGGAAAKATKTVAKDPKLKSAPKMDVMKTTSTNALKTKPPVNFNTTKVVSGEQMMANQAAGRAAKKQTYRQSLNSL